MISIHDPCPKDRLAAARAVSNAGGAEPPQLPPYWTGVSNPWLLFLGPSPGNSPGPVAAAEGFDLPTLGSPHPHLATNNDSNGFWQRIREWTHRSFLLAGIFQDPLDSYSSVLVGNLLATTQGDSRKLQKADLVAAIPDVARTIRQLQPRIVVTMDKRISAPLVRSLLDQGMTQLAFQQQEVEAKNQNYKYYRPHFWDLSDSQWDLRVIEAPQHPTKRNFYDAAVMDDFLAEHFRSVLAC